MKILIKILFILFFGIIGFIYNFLAPYFSEFLIPWHIQHYSYNIDAGEDQIWPDFFIGGCFFMIFWCWLGLTTYNNPLRGLLRIIVLIISSFLFFFITYKFWPVINNPHPQSAFVNGLYCITWCIVSLVSVLMIKINKDRIDRVRSDT